MSDYGVTKFGFVIKPFQDILTDKAARAREMFGDDVDLRSTSALRKILDICSAEDQELWKRMEQLYYSNFISTASGDALDLLGDDIDVPRRFLTAKGKVKFKLSGEASGRTYNLPIGTLVETDPIPTVRQYRTLSRVTLSSQSKEAVVDIESTARGQNGNVAINAINKLNATFTQRNLNLGGALIDVKNESPTTGGELREDDASYRALLLGRPRTLWTLEAVRNTVKNVDGVRDCRLFDPLGGVDVSLSKFKFFNFSQRRFGTQRLLGTPYFFDILVAIYPGFLWENEGLVTGVQDDIEKAIREVRPISIFPNLRLANNVLVGIRAKVLIKSGHDKNAVIASIKEKLELRVNALGLGNAVLYAEVLCDCMDVAGVIDIQQLHLRRCPPILGTITFGRSQHFQEQIIEMAVGENLPLQPDEISIFKIDSQLIDLQVGDR
ncbi:MAG: baseplate J/gp47 family protein [Methylococcaceae bacterium]